MTFIKFFLVLTLASWSFLTALASDSEANELLNEAKQEFADGDYFDSANTALDAEHMADSVTIKVDAVKQAIIGFRKANMLYREFQNIEKLLNSYPSHANYAELIAREFEIADAFYSGYRDPSYHPLRWVPWLKDEDRSVEVYNAALGHAPFADERAAESKLRTAIKIMDTGENLNRALELLRGIVKDYPDSPQAKRALLRLGIALSALAEQGDGDGAYNREAIVALNEFITKYPDAPEVDYINKKILKTHDIQAKRLLNIADFYHQNGHDEVAQRYLVEIVRNYPDSTSTAQAEEILTNMDQTYIPQPLQPAIEPRVQTYDTYAMPAHKGKLLIAPQYSDGKYLLPIRDLGIGNAEGGE